MARVRNCAGSPVYGAPEVLRKKYDHSADMWSAGILAYMLLTARLPWHGNWGVGVAELYAGSNALCEDRWKLKHHGDTVGVPNGFRCQSRTGTAGFGRRDALEALLTFELDFESPDFTRVSDEAKHFVQVRALRSCSPRLTEVGCTAAGHLGAPDRMLTLDVSNAEPAAKRSTETAEG